MHYQSPTDSPLQTMNAIRASPSEKVTLLVTADADNFSIVDITGAMTPAFIRERIFTKVSLTPLMHHDRVGIVFIDLHA